MSQRSLAHRTSIRLVWRWVEDGADKGREVDRWIADGLVGFVRLLKVPHVVGVGVMTSLFVLGTLETCGWLRTTYGWFVRFFQPGVWAAMAAWITAGIAVGAFIYAKRQVSEARRSREQQARHFRETLDHDAEQAQRTRDEMAQPNVVMYAEPNEDDWQQLEVVIKNFGGTPAYDVVPIIEPPLQSLPNLISDGEIYEIPIPTSISVLAPGQEWRTFWDSAVERRQKEREIKNEIIANWPGGPPTGTDFDPLIAERMPHTRHTGKVQYWDSKQKLHKTTAILDFNMLKGSMRSKRYGIHHIAKKYIEDG